MLETNDNLELAQLLFPNVTKTVEELEEQFPQRLLPEGAMVTRFAPSPTGFLHIGGLFSALISKLNADLNGGTFILRIEDTDKKREIEGGIGEITKGLDAFGVNADEGFISKSEEVGDYGPYQQSKRAQIYHTVAKKLVEQGLAYPCFCTSEELEQIRLQQESDGASIKGYFGKYAKYRNASFEEQKMLIESGKPYVLRLRSQGVEGKKIIFSDLIKGKIEMQENFSDVVLLKTDGIPTYHFAHTCDDHFMRVTHVIRGDEWISSVPLHIELFRLCGFKAPKYAHISPIMKMDEGSKRKLSKRKDPEAAVTFYAEEGYPKEAVIEYLLTLANSNFEDWRRANPLESTSKFPFNLKKMSVSGALFDLAKLNDISKTVISKFSADEVYSKLITWAKLNSAEFFKILTFDEQRSKAILNIDRQNAKPRKDIAKWSEVEEYYSYIFNPFVFDCSQMPEQIDKEIQAKALEKYAEIYDESDDNSLWFERIKSISESLGFASDMKRYKKDEEYKSQFAGTVADLSTIIRVAVTGRRNTPTLCDIMKILGKSEVFSRLNKAAESLRANN